VSGQSPGPQIDVIVSTTSETQVGGYSVRDEDILCRAGGGLPYVSLPAETTAALAGQLGSSSTHHVFGDIDAVHDAGEGLAVNGLYLSLLSNEAGFLDGDVLRGGPDGFEVFLAEQDFVAACGLVDGNADIDAFHMDPDGRVFFSFAENEASSFLGGDTPLVIADGAILLWMPFMGSADILYRESTMDGFVSTALGSTVKVGDVKGVSRDPSGSELLFTVQSPSEHDASIFSASNGGMLLPGLEEDSWGFSTSTEFDALSVVSRTWPALGTSDALPQIGVPGFLTIRGGQPDAAYFVMLALDLGDPQIPTGGWGGLVLANDALFGASLQLALERTIVTDGLGEASLGFVLPAGAPSVDMFVQAVGLSPPYVGTNPIVVEVGQ
jgi:hypothetical protein